MARSRPPAPACASTCRVGAAAEVAVPLTRPRYDTGNRDSRINLGIPTAP
ncbi:MAG: hypothetical protein ACTHJR_03085 [Sphingomonas sp.]